MEPDEQGPEPSVRNEVSGKVGGNVYQGRELTVNHVTNLIQGMPTREWKRPKGFAPWSSIFVNRLPVMARMTEAVTKPGRSGAAVVALSGGGGVGKTALTAHWSRQVAEDLYPDGTMYVDLRIVRANGGAGLSTVLAKLLIQCGWEAWELANDLPGLHAQFQAHIKDKRVLVVVDHVENEAEVTALRPDSPDGAMIITGHVGGEYTMDQQSLTVEPLDGEAAFELVSELIGAERADAEHNEVRELVRLCGRVPKVIGIALGPVLRHESVTVGDALASLREDLERLPESGDVADMLELVADYSYRSLREQTARLYRGLGHIPGPDFAKPAILALAASQGGNGSSMFAELLDHHLLDSKGDDRFALSDLVRAHARRCSAAEDRPETEHETVADLAAWYVGWAHCADTAIIPFRTRVFTTDVSARPPFANDAAAARDWFDAERHNLIAIQRYCAAQGITDPRWLDLVLRLGESMWVMFIGGRYLEDWLESSRLAVAAAVDAGHRAAEVRFRAFLARVLMEYGSWAEAARELAIARELPMVDGIGPDLRASAFEFTGRLFSYQGDHRGAVEWYRQAIPLFAAQADRTDLLAASRAASARGVALQLQFIGRCLLKLGHLPDAEKHLRQAETRMLDIGHERDVATIRTELGEALRRLDRVDEAFTVVSAAVDVLADKKWYRIETNALWELSLIAEVRGETELERTCLERLRDVYFGTANARLDDVMARLARLSGD